MLPEPPKGGLDLTRMDSVGKLTEKNHRHVLEAVRLFQKFVLQGQHNHLTGRIGVEVILRDGVIHRDPEVGYGGRQSKASP